MAHLFLSSMLVLDYLTFSALPRGDALMLEGSRMLLRPLSSSEMRRSIDWSFTVPGFIFTIVIDYFMALNFCSSASLFWALKDHSLVAKSSGFRLSTARAALSFLWLIDPDLVCSPDFFRKWMSFRFRTSFCTVWF